MEPRRRRIARAAQLLLGALLLYFVARELTGQWRELGDSLSSLAPRWSLLLAASGVVLAAYALLVQLWRTVLRLWGEELSFPDAVRIWCVSSLGRYVPGRVWQIGAMAAMSRARGISPLAATGSAILNTGINVVTGIALTLVLARPYVEAQLPGGAAVGTAITVVAFAALGVLPWVLPAAVRRVARWRGAPIPDLRIPPGAIWLTAAGNVVAWLLYGLAFQLFTAGLLGRAAGGLLSYISVYAGSYVLGYLSVFTVGGLGVREAVMATAMTAFGLAPAPDALVVALASRLWLTLLEVLPGLGYLALPSGRRRSSNSLRDVAP